MIDIGTVQSTWSTLERQPAVAGRMRAIHVAGTSALVALDSKGGRHLLVVLTAHDEVQPDPRVRGLSVDIKRLILDEGHADEYLDVECTDTANVSAFDLVIGDVVTAIAGGKPAPQAVIDVVVKWRRFWSKCPANVLGREAIIGLFGELWFLRVWLLPRNLQYVASWLGPRGQRHDFQFTGDSVEVKTTVSTKGHVHRINGLDQLEPPDDGKLWLYSLQAREEQSSTNAVPALIAEASKLLAGTPALLAILEDRLDELGYSPLHQLHYEQYRFHIVEERFYTVVDGFPRLRKADIPRLDGIQGIEYTIDLGVCSHLCVGRRPSDLPPLIPL